MMAEYQKNKEYRKKSDYHGTYKQEHKRTVLLTKSDKDVTYSREGSSKKTILTSSSKEEKPQTITIKTREGERSSSPNLKTAPAKKDETTQPVYQLQSKPSTTETVAVSEMTSAVKLIDGETFNILDNCVDYLSEEMDFLVVACVGAQGVGKSTVMSLLADPSLIDNIEHGKYLFPVQKQQDMECCLNKTEGIDMYITKNRIILLDTQAIMSPAVAFKLLQQNDGNVMNKKLLPTELSIIDMYQYEVQSYQLTTFLFSVAHLVIFVQDYYCHGDLLRFLQTAEMLKPSTGTTTVDETIIEYFPHLLFLQNKCEPADFEPKNIKQMQEIYNKTFLHSRLQIQTGFGVTNSDVEPAFSADCNKEPINLYLLPDFDTDSSLDYRGHPGVKHLVCKLRNQVLATPRNPLTHTALTEKNWFHYASKVWEGIKKSTFFSEYNRLLNNLSIPRLQD